MNNTKIKFKIGQVYESLQSPFKMRIVRLSAQSVTFVTSERTTSTQPIGSMSTHISSHFKLDVTETFKNFKEINK